MALKLIPTDGRGTATQQYKSIKSKPKPYIQAIEITNYIKARDMSMLQTCDHETAQAIKERWGIQV